MNIFEDLIEELKEENLLEETVIEAHKEKTFAGSFQAMPGNKNPAFGKKEEKGDAHPPLPSILNDGQNEFSQNFPALEEIYPAQGGDFEAAPEMPEIADETVETYAPQPAVNYPPVQKNRAIVSEKEYFRKRAMDEVTSLQMVDHVLAGVEREQMKVVPKPYDDLPVKLALHDFLQVVHEANSTEHAQSEFRLMQETENWCSALAHRDKNITIAHLRRYCETSRPPLSPQALIALARFYRNSSYSEAVRNKFELVITRLFSQADEFEFRKLLLSRNEILLQLKELYVDWASIQLYSPNEGDPDLLISVLKFEDFVTEAEISNNFEELISNDFFNRLRLFKQNCNENFFAPTVAVAAIEANVRIGNRYLELLNQEKEKSNISVLEEKYGFLHDQAISDATGKTFQLAALLNERSETVKKEPETIVEVSVKEPTKSPQVTAPKPPRSKVFAVNKWLLTATILTIVVCAGLYFWAEYETQELKPSASVKKVNLDNSEFKDFIQTARISNEGFFGITTPAWESMARDKKEEMLKKLLSVGAEKNYKKVHLINGNGKAIAFASAEKVEIYNQ